MAALGRWQGTPEEWQRIADAVARHCAYEFGLMGVRVSTCSPHRMLAEDGARGGLLFARHIVECLRREEWA